MQSAISPTLTDTPAPVLPAHTIMRLHNRIGLAILMGALVAVVFGARIGAASFQRLRLG